jgi:hypothetical protein
MSWRTRCNYCVLQAIMQQAVRDKVEVTLRQDSHGWTEVWEDGTHTHTMLAISDHCVC